VHFRDEESAEKAISSMNGSLLFGLELTVMKSTSSQGGTSGYTNVFVGNIDFGSEEEVRNVFSRFGKITRVVFSQDKRGRPFACVNFSNNSEAQDVCLLLLLLLLLLSSSSFFLFKPLSLSLDHAHHRRPSIP
jgi:RNA recognition motif-containing protein